MTFDGDALNGFIKNLSPIDDEFLEGILGTQKDNCYAFPILSLLYPHLDYKNNDFHKDHLHAEDLYDSMSEELKNKYPFKVYNSILNLQMLDKNENESKGKMSLADWVDKVCQNPDAREAFLRVHIIPDVNLSLENFEEFIEKRHVLLKTKLISILTGSNQSV